MPRFRKDSFWGDFFNHLFLSPPYREKNKPDYMTLKDAIIESWSTPTMHSEDPLMGLNADRIETLAIRAAHVAIKMLGD